LAETPFVALTAPTSTGRNTIIDELVKTGRYHFIVSDTTRPPRYNDGILEQDGVRYHFKTEDDILAGIKQGAYIEAEVIHDQQVSGQSISEVEAAHKEGKIAINEVDIGGALKMKLLKPDVTAILVLPPSFEEWLKRIHKRTEVSDVELKRRLKRAVELLDTALKYDYFIFVINDNFHEAVGVVDRLVREGKHDKNAEAKSRLLAKKLHNKTLRYLAGTLDW
jgi:guanylate kinase